MSVELRPLGIRCNISCRYCYQQPQRSAGNAVAQKYDLELMKAAVAEEGGPFTLFGGEPLLVNICDLEELWAWGLERFGSNSVQTNGVLIQDQHIRLFKRYKVAVGISIDGPGELNDLRRAGTLAQTRAATGNTEAAIRRLCAEGISPSLIVTLHRGNATSKHLPRLHDWFRELDRLGVTSVRLHLLESESAAVRDRYALSPQENRRAFLGCAALERELRCLRFDLFTEINGLLAGNDRQVSCVWHGCDPYTTSAVRGVEGRGRRSSCGRTNKEGIDFLKSGSPASVRPIALFSTPREQGGCRGCRFFVFCKGQCPGTAIDGDWRNRSESCELWFTLLEHAEARLTEAGEQPLSRHHRLPEIEQAMLTAWSQSSNRTLAEIVEGLGEPLQSTTAQTVQLPPGFVRSQWVSERARDTWSQRFRDIVRACLEASLKGVADGQWRCARRRIAAWQLFDLRPRARHYDLSFELLPTAPSTDPYQPLSYEVLIGSALDLQLLQQAMAHTDNDQVERILGVPSCCRRSHRQSHDLFELALRTAGARCQGSVVEVDSYPMTNVLWRPLDLVAITHQPCSFDCSGSIQLGEVIIDLAAGAGYRQESEWLAELLSWPVEWSVLNGIAELRTPVMKVSTDAVGSTQKQTLRLRGESYPAAGASGICFPYRTP